MPEGLPVELSGIAVMGTKQYKVKRSDPISGHAHGCGCGCSRCAEASPCARGSSARGCAVVATRVTVAAVVLAAGAGSRFGGEQHKLLTEVRGRPLVALGHRARGPKRASTRRSSSPALSTSTGSRSTASRWSATRGGPRARPPRCRPAVRHADDAGHDAIVVGLADQPGVPPEAWRRSRRTVDARSRSPTYDGERRNPVRLADEIWPLLPTSGDEGARVADAQYGPISSAK